MTNTCKDLEPCGIVPLENLVVRVPKKGFSRKHCFELCNPDSSFIKSCKIQNGTLLITLHSAHTHTHTHKLNLSQEHSCRATTRPTCSAHKGRRKWRTGWRPFAIRSSPTLSTSSSPRAPNTSCSKRRRRESASMRKRKTKVLFCVCLVFACVYFCLFYYEL
jgi:hypothetical protein